MRERKKFWREGIGLSVLARNPGASAVCPAYDGRNEMTVSSLIARVCPSTEPNACDDHARDQRIDVL